MTAKKVFITGAAGQTGLQCVKHLAESGAKMDIYAGVHKGETQQESLVKSFNVRPSVIEATDPKQLTECFRDVQDLFIVPSSTENKVEHARNYINAAKEAGVKFVLLLSVMGADRKDYSWGSQFCQIEEHLKQANLASWCIIRTPFYAQNLLLYKQQIKEGWLPLPTDEGRFPAMDVTDVGLLASVILKDCNPHKHKVYEVTGPEAMNGAEIARVVSTVLGRDIKWKNITLDEARSILKAQNVPEVEIKGLLDFYQLAKTNCWTRATNDYETVVGHKPATMHEFITRNKSQLM